jgi:hypothetical protein
MKKNQNKEKITSNIFKKVTSFHIKKSMKKHIFNLFKNKDFLKNFKTDNDLV